MLRNKQLKVLLVRPLSPLGKFEVVNMQHPINICILGRISDTLGHKTFIYDFEIEGRDINRFIEFVRKIKPDVVGFSATTPQVKISNLLSKLIKRIFPEVIAVLGGAHISALPQESLVEFNSIDIGFIGEADISFKNFLINLSEGAGFSKIQGIVYRDGERIYKNNPAERLDLKVIDYIPARYLLNLSSYFRRNRFKNVASPGVYKKDMVATQMFTSRGCNFRCIFCANTANFGNFRATPKIISRDISSVREEIIECKNVFGINHFSLQDELFPSSRDFLSKFCEIAQREKITFNCNSRVDILKEEDYKLLSRSGCLQIGFGVESGSERILKKIGKRISLSDVANAIDYSRKYNIRTVTYFLIGSHPDENNADIQETIKFIKEVKPDLITCTLAVPYPGTVLRRLLEERGLIFSNDWDRYAYYSDSPVWKTFNLTSDELIANQKKVLKSFYLSFDTLYRRLKILSSWSELFMLAEGGIRMLSFLKNKKERR